MVDVTLAMSSMMAVVNVSVEIIASNVNLRVSIYRITIAGVADCLTVTVKNVQLVSNA